MDTMGLLDFPAQNKMESNVHEPAANSCFERGVDFWIQTLRENFIPRCKTAQNK